MPQPITHNIHIDMYHPVAALSDSDAPAPTNDTQTSYPQK